MNYFTKRNIRAILCAIHFYLLNGIPDEIVFQHDERGNIKFIY